MNKKKIYSDKNVIPSPSSVTLAELYKIIEEEAGKEDSERDLDLIMECSKLLEELTSPQTLSETEYNAGLRKIYNRAAVDERNDNVHIIENSHSKELGRVRTDQNKSRFTLMLAMIPVAVIMCLFFTFVIASAAQDLTVSELILSIMDKLDTMNPGETIDEANITFIKGDEMVLFTSIEEAMELCSFDCMFPTAFPEGIYVEKIVEIMGDSPENKAIMFVTNREDFTICVNDHMTIDTAAWENTQVYQAKHITFTIIEFGEERQAVGVCDGIEYVIYCQGIDESDFLMILDGMSE